MKKITLKDLRKQIAELENQTRALYDGESKETKSLRNQLAVIEKKYQDKREEVDSKIKATGKLLIQSLIPKVKWTEEEMWQKIDKAEDRERRDLHLSDRQRETIVVAYAKYNPNWEYLFYCTNYEFAMRVKIFYILIRWTI